MSNAARKAAKARSAKAVRDTMAKRGFSPLERLMDLLEEEIELPGSENGSGPDETEKASGGKQRRMLGLDQGAGGLFDWELAPGFKTLRLRASLRMKILVELLPYEYAKPRGDEGEPNSVTVIIEGANGEVKQQQVVPRGWSRSE